MDRTTFERYLSRFPAYGGRGKTALPGVVRRALDAACMKAAAGIKESWIESSASSHAPELARFTHCYRLENGLGVEGHQRVWKLAYRRFLALLLELGKNGARFDVKKAVRIENALYNPLYRWSPVLVSAEWRPGTEEFLKATLYVGMQRPLGAASARLAAIAGSGADWMGPVSEKDMDVLGADFYPDGSVEFKVYRQYPREKAELAGRAGRFARRITSVSDYASIYKAYKLNGRTGRPFLYKTHFSFDRGVDPAALVRGESSAAASAVSVFQERAADLSRITAAGVQPRGPYFEIYFS